MKFQLALCCLLTLATFFQNLSTNTELVNKHLFDYFDKESKTQFNGELVVPISLLEKTSTEQNKASMISGAVVIQKAETELKHCQIFRGEISWTLTKVELQSHKYRAETLFYWVATFCDRADLENTKSKKLALIGVLLDGTTVVPKWKKHKVSGPFEPSLQPIPMN